MEEKNRKKLNFEGGIEFAPQISIESHQDIAYDLLEKVYGIKEAFISDESSLWDFPLDEDEAVNKIQEIYGVDVSDVKDHNLALICQRIAILRGG